MKNKEKSFYFTTRELITMAAFAAVGGIASTYINMIGDFFQSFLGFAGTTQWAAGLHVVWLMLAAVIIRKPGVASTAGILKGAVEFFSGNTHGLLVVIVDILAGVLIDLIFLAKRKDAFNIWFYLAAGISSASNIFVFQLFASVPSDLLTVLIIGAAASGAFLSGIIFGGILVRSIYKAVQKAGLIPTIEPQKINKNIWPLVIIVLAVISIIAVGWIYFAQQGNAQGISVSGNVNDPYVISSKDLVKNTVVITASLNDVERTYEGVRLADIIARAEPKSEDGLLLIKASDGYGYFITLEEVFSNKNLILSTQGVGKTFTVNVIGARSQKAWVRGVSELVVSDSNAGIEISGNVNSGFTFLPDEWQEDLDSFYMQLETGPKKLQGVPLEIIIDKTNPQKTDYQIQIISSDDDTYLLSSQQIDQSNRTVRIFILATESSVQYVFGNIDGEVYIENISRIEIK